MRVREFQDIFVVRKSSGHGRFDVNDHARMKTAHEFVGWVKETTGTNPFEKCRCHEHFSCRRAIAFALRKYGLSYPAIGVVLRRDHSTIHTAVRLISPELELVAIRLWEAFQMGVDNGTHRDAGRTDDQP